MRSVLFFILLFTGTFVGTAKAANKLNCFDSLPGKILIINSFDAGTMKARKNKKELFGELADSLKQLLNKDVEKELLMQSDVYTPLFPENGSDSSISDLLDKNNATKAIIIRKIDIHFEQTGVEVTGTKGDKTRTASYDICAFITYEFYDRVTKPDASEIRYCEYSSDRNVVSGLLAGGPDIVAKKKQAYKVMAKNARQYLNEIYYRIKKQ